MSEVKAALIIVLAAAYLIALEIVAHAIARNNRLTTCH